MKLKNYTTSTTAEKSISEIERILAEFGATAVMKEYRSDSTVTSLAFKLGDKAYKLPANIDGVEMVLFKDKRPHHGKNVMVGRYQRAYRVAWRILKDWVHVQLSLVASGQAQPEQILLHCQWDGKRTLYDAYKEGMLKIEDNSENTKSIEAEVVSNV